MARRRTKLARMLDMKPRAYALFRSATAVYPGARPAIGFFPDIGPLPDRIERVSEEMDYTVRLADPKYKPILEQLAVENWDVYRPNIQHQDPFVSKRFVGIVADVAVPGHTLTPVDPATGKQIVFGQSGPSNWNFAHPGPSAFSGRTVEVPAIVIPPYWNYWHIFFEHLLPFIHASRLGAWGEDPIVVVTRKCRPPLIDAVIAGLRDRGFAIEIDEVRPWEHLRLKRMLVAVNQCWNVERSYALAEAIPTAREVFAAAYKDRPQPRGAGKRLYLARGRSKLRQVSGEDDLIESLQRLGFTVFNAAWSNHEEQIAAFSGAEVIVSIHGAGLSNLVFAQPGTKVMEIFADDFRKTGMVHLSAEHDLDHHAFFGSREGKNQAFSVDVPALTQAIEALL